MIRSFFNFQSATWPSHSARQSTIKHQAEVKSKVNAKVKPHGNINISNPPISTMTEDSDSDDGDERMEYFYDLIICTP